MQLSHNITYTANIINIKYTKYINYTDNKKQCISRSGGKKTKCNAKLFHLLHDQDQVPFFASCPQFLDVIGSAPFSVYKFNIYYVCIFLIYLCKAKDIVTTFIVLH